MVQPDLAVEIRSPSTRSKDMILKLYKYQNAGVREYWVVDPKTRSIFPEEPAGLIFHVYKSPIKYGANIKPRLYTKEL